MIRWLAAFTAGLLLGLTGAALAQRPPYDRVVGASVLLYVETDRAGRAVAIHSTPPAALAWVRRLLTGGCDG